MNAADIVDHERRKAATAALAIAGACLTDDQVTLLAGILAGKSPSEVKAMFNAVLPAQRDRTGILLPYITLGSLSEFPARAHDLVVVLLGLAYQDAKDGAASAITEVRKAINLVTRGAAPGHRLATAASQVSTSNNMYMAFRATGEAVAPGQVWASAGLSAESLSTGFAGTRELKGSLPDSAGPAGRTPVAAPRATGDRSTLSGADVLEEGEL